MFALKMVDFFAATVLTSTRFLRSTNQTMMKSWCYLSCLRQTILRVYVSCLLHFLYCSYFLYLLHHRCLM